MENKIEPLPCPFCGHGAMVEATPVKNWRVTCSYQGQGDETHCLINGPIRAQKADAVAAWNNRSLEVKEALEEARHGIRSVINLVYKLQDSPKSLLDTLTTDLPSMEKTLYRLTALLEKKK